VMVHFFQMAGPATPVALFFGMVGGIGRSL